MGVQPSAADQMVAERLARARQRSVMICTPIARNPVWQYTASLASTLLYLQEQGVKVTFQFVVGNSVIHKARNELCAHFLMSDCTDLLFIDDDMQWAPEAIMRLLGSEQPLIGGVGRMRCQKPNSDPAVWCWRPIHDAAGSLIQDDMGAVEVRGFGAAFMMINKAVFAEMVTKHPEWKRTGMADWPKDLRDHYFEFFPASERDEIGELSEDYGFCHRWRQMGGQVWCDPTIRLGHVGAFNFAGAVEDILIPHGANQ